MRDAMKLGDTVLFYHSSCEEPGVQGLGKVASAPYPDPTQFEKGGEYFEPRATKEKPVWWLVDIAWAEDFASPVTLERIKADKRLAGMLILRPGNRLSITPVTAAEEKAVRALGAG